VQPNWQKDWVSDSINDKVVISMENESKIEVSWHCKEKNNEKTQTNLLKVQVRKAV